MNMPREPGWPQAVNGFDLPLDWIVSGLAIFLAAGLKLAGVL